MAIEKRECEVAKEVDDVAKLLVDLVVDLKAGKDVASITSENLPGLITAIDGANKMSDEIANNRKVVLSTIGARAGELADAILGGSSS